MPDLRREPIFLLHDVALTMRTRFDKWARGLVERRADPGDRRIRRLHLLPAAQPILAHIENYTDEIIEILLGEVDPRAVQTMLDVLLHMKNKLAMESAGEKLILAGE